MTKIINDSLKSAVLPSSYKSAIVTPLLKKHSLDPNDLKNYRPVKLPFLKLSMTFFWQWMRSSCRLWYSLTYLQRLIPLTMIFYFTAYSIYLVFKALCYLGSDLISLKDIKFCQRKVFILTKLSYVVVYLRALFYDPFFLFFIHSFSLVLFLNSQYLTCCMLMIHKYTNH